MRFCPNRHGIFAEQADICPDCGERLVTDRRGSDAIAGLRLTRLLGRGGMRSSVWEATRDDGEAVAVKVAEADAEQAERSRLLASAQLTVGLAHPNIVPVLSYGETGDGEVFLVMELVKGKTLTSLMSTKPALPVTVAAHVAREVLAGLAALHGQGIVHRDVKPSNIHVAPRGPGEPWEVKLLDFGVARRFTPGEVPPTLDLAAAQPGQFGAIIGTPEYMAPEQVLGLGADPRSDLYALGLVLHRTLTGVSPIAGADRHACFEAHLRGALAPLEMPDGFPAPAGLAQAIERATAKQPGDRYRSAADLRSALTPY